MAPERLKDTVLPNALADVAGDLAELLQKELRLARVEISQKISNKVKVGIWMSAAAGLGLITVILVVQALVFGIASYGIAMHWSCLIVAGVFASFGALAYFKGRANAEEDLTPTRTLENIRRDITTAKEQLT